MASAGTYNRISLIGFTASEAEKHTGEKGSAVSFPLMTRRQWKAKDGAMQKRTDFHRVVFFGTRGDKLLPYLSKGKKLFIEGELQTNSYVNKDGEKKFSSEVTADKILFLDPKEKNGATGGEGDSEETEDDEEEEE